MADAKQGKGGRRINGFRTKVHVTEDRAQDDVDDYKVRPTRSRRVPENLFPDGVMAMGDEDLDGLHFARLFERRHPADGTMPGRARDFFSVTVDPAEQSTIVAHALLTENFQLKNKVRELKEHLTNSKLETAELYSKFGSLAEEWRHTVNELKGTLDDQKASYEERISALEKTNEKLREENKELRAMVKELYEKQKTLKDQERQLKIGQIGFALEGLVAEIVFPGKGKAEKRLRYGLQLKDVHTRVGKIPDDTLKHNAQGRLETIPTELFEDWVFGIVDDIKKMRLPHAHPELDSYEEVIKEIKVHYKDDQDKCEDLITIVDHLKTLYDRQELPFGGGASTS